MRRFLRGLIVAAWLIGPSPAGACPLCESETGSRVREGIFGPDFARDLASTLLPFAVFLGVAASIHLGGPWPAGSVAPPTPSKVEDQR